MKSKGIAPLALAPVIAGLVLAVGVATVFSACGVKDDGTWMHCHTAQNAVMWIALAIAALSAAAAFVKSAPVQSALYAVGAAAGIVAFFIPGPIVPMCMMHTMRCFEVMQPFVRIMAVVIVMLCVAAAVRSLPATMKKQVKRGL